MRAELLPIFRPVRFFRDVLDGETTDTDIAAGDGDEPGIRLE